MLVDVEAKPNLITAVIADGKRSRRIQQGVYENGHWSFELEFRGRQVFDLDFPDLGDFNCYGVCDSPDQFLAKLPESVKVSPKQYVVSMVRLLKSEQSPSGGWRWHKWGPYIGEQQPTCEYLADEPLIEEVWTYHIYQVA